MPLGPKSCFHNRYYQEQREQWDLVALAPPVLLYQTID
jgi:hypothetical protein